MFSDDQMKKISFFASLTKISNECFKKCVHFEPYITEEKPIEKSLSNSEAICLKSCSNNFIKLREFVEVQLQEDYSSIKRKNKKILDDET